MANMARKEAPGRYQIGIYSVEREGKRWRVTTRDENFRMTFRSLAEAHRQLTGESMREESR